MCQLDKLLRFKDVLMLETLKLLILSQKRKEKRESRRRVQIELATKLTDVCKNFVVVVKKKKKNRPQNKMSVASCVTS